MTGRDEDQGKMKFAVFVREMRESMSAHIEFAQLDAKIKRAKYVALVAQGFDERQALELCR